MRITLKEIGTERRFGVETNATTLSGLKRACDWIPESRYVIEEVTGGCLDFDTLIEFENWL